MKSSEEIQRLRARSSFVVRELATVLMRQYKRSMYVMKDDDRFRLYKWYIWSQRYSVSIEYITITILDHFYHQVKPRNRNGLGLRIASITGNGAEVYLAEAVSKEFPDLENITDRKTMEQARIKSILEGEDEFVPKTKSPLSFGKVQDFVDYYRQKTVRERRKNGKIAKTMKRMPWRDNPFL